MGPHHHALGLATAGVVISFWAMPSAAYQTASIVSDDCHEAMTLEAHAAVRRELQLEVSKPTRQERALIDDAPFPVPSDQRDLAAVSLVLGNRDVDLNGNEPDDLDQLAQVHGDPTGQEEHCLRRATDDGPEGDALALERCRGVLESRVASALDGTSEDGSPDLDDRTELDVFLDLRGAKRRVGPRRYPGSVDPTGA
jgi:hypothetical protein